MIVIAERVFEDGLWFLILVVVLAFFWFHHRARSRPNLSAEETVQKAAEVESSRVEKAG